LKGLKGLKCLKGLKSLKCLKACLLRGGFEEFERFDIASLTNPHYSLFTIRYSLFTIRYSLFTIRYSLFTIHSSQPDFGHTGSGLKGYNLKALSYNGFDSAQPDIASLTTPHYSLFTIHYSLFTLHYSLPTPHIPRNLLITFIRQMFCNSTVPINL